ncbi:hypothetical protein G6F23_014485 [Rhizopus arrhizus]|nr:hypothetical protein G6F23_014485 [Rhizopus arrhizus]
MQRGVQRVAQHQYSLVSVQIELRTCKPLLVGVPQRATAAAAGQGATRTIDRQPHQVTAAVLAMGFSPQRTEPATGRIKAPSKSTSSRPHRELPAASAAPASVWRLPDGES